MWSRLRRQSGFSYLPILIVVAIFGVLWWQRTAILASAGTFLNVGEAPRKADVIVVLAGGWEGGGRVLKAGELVRAGYAPYALMSGPRSFYNQPECSAALPFAVQSGFPAEYFQCAPNHALNTEEEASALLAELQRRKVKSFLVVSVDSHLRRASAIFRRKLPEGMEIHFVSSESPGFRLAEWWKTREGRKAFFLEWTKLISSQFGV
ncbi:MAG: YdcF family protein [Bryobacterales bacterium]|nr:YdcF family protein [Bryobacterales bacterium]